MPKRPPWYPADQCPAGLAAALATGPFAPLPNLVFVPCNTSNVEILQRPIEFARYLSIRYSERLADVGITPSVGRVGNPYDSALAETVIGLFKTEVIRRRGPWPNLEAVEFATLDWVDWFNHQRLLGPIGHIPPA